MGLNSKRITGIHADKIGATVEEAACLPVFYIVHGGDSESGHTVCFLKDNNTFTSNVKSAKVFNYINSAHDRMHELNEMLKRQSHPLAGKVRVVQMALQFVEDNRDQTAEEKAQTERDTAETVERKTKMREDTYRELCSLINKVGNGAVIPKMYVCDPLASSLNYGISIDPVLLEKYLMKYQRVEFPKGKSLSEVIADNFGQRASELAMLLV